MIRVVMVDDHELVRHGFVELLERDVTIQVVFQTSSLEEAENWLSDHGTDVLILDLSFKERSGFVLLEYVQQHCPETAVLILSMHDTIPYIKKALENGAKGYLSKNSGPDELLSAVYSLAEGEGYLGKEISNSLTFCHTNPEFKKVAMLTEREMEVFGFLARGLEVKEVSKELDIMPKTVHVHRASVLAKLGVRNSFDLTRIALRNGYLDMQDLMAY